MADNKEGSKVNRRNVLRTVAAGVATAAVGFAQPATADPDGISAARTLMNEYRSNRAIEGAFARYTPELLQTLFENGLISAPSLKSLHGDADLAQSVSVGGIVTNDVETAHLQLTARTDGGELVIVVQPHEGETYAFFDPKGDDGRLSIKPSRDGATIQGHCDKVDERCSSSVCSGGYYNCAIYEQYCCGTDCSWEVTSDCCCSSFGCC